MCATPQQQIPKHLRESLVSEWGSGISSRLSSVCKSFLVIVYHLRYPAVLNPKLLHSFWGQLGEESKAFQVVESKWHIAKVITMDVE